MVSIEKNYGMIFFVKNLLARSVFSRNLIKWRKVRHLTQEELAKSAGVSRFIIAYYETKVTDPPASVLISISKALGVSIEDLVLANTSRNSASQVPLVDARTFKKLAPVAGLPRQQRLYVYKIIDSLVKDNQSSAHNTVAEKTLAYADTEE